MCLLDFTCSLRVITSFTNTYEQVYEHLGSQTGDLEVGFCQISSVILYQRKEFRNTNFSQQAAYSRVNFEIACRTPMNLTRLLTVSGFHFNTQSDGLECREPFSKADVIDPVLRDLHPDLLFLVLNLLMKGHRALAYLSEVGLDLNSRK